MDSILALAAMPLIRGRSKRQIPWPVMGQCAAATRGGASLGGQLAALSQRAIRHPDRLRSFPRAGRRRALQLLPAARGGAPRAYEEALPRRRACACAVPRAGQGFHPARGWMIALESATA